LFITLFEQESCYLEPARRGQFGFLPAKAVFESLSDYPHTTMTFDYKRHLDFARIELVKQLGIQTIELNPKGLMDSTEVHEATFIYMNEEWLPEYANQVCLEAGSPRAKRQAMAEALLALGILGITSNQWISKENIPEAKLGEDIHRKLMLRSKRFRHSWTKKFVYEGLFSHNMEFNLNEKGWLAHEWEVSSTFNPDARHLNLAPAPLYDWLQGELQKRMGDYSKGECLLSFGSLKMVDWACEILFYNQL
jgi:hypothetical protein